VAGILVDLYSQPYVGVNALMYMYIGLAISNFAGSLIKKNIWTVALGVLVVSVVYHTALLIISYVIPGYASFGYPFLRIVLPTALYDGVIAIVVSCWARWLSEERIKGL
jgi:rod shape-determining protein MreD